MRKQLVLASVAVLAAASASPASADVVIGPRASYYFDNSNLRTSGIGSDQPEEIALEPEEAAVLEAAFGLPPRLTMQTETTGLLADQIGFPMIGAMVNFGDDRNRFTLTAMYGSGSGNIALSTTLSRTLTLGDAQFVDLVSLGADARNTTDRLDVEMTWQGRQSESFALLGGVRYERLDSTYAGDLTITQTAAIPSLIVAAENIVAGNPPTPTLPSPPPIRAQLVERGTIQTFSARGGATAFVPINESAVAFFNGMLQASYRPGYKVRTVISGAGEGFDGTETGRDPKEISVGPDLSVGAQFVLAQNLALDLRYRAVIFFPLSGAESFSDARVNHGVNLGLSLRL